jgi:acetyl esterase/lipase
MAAGGRAPQAFPKEHENFMRRKASGCASATNKIGRPSAAEAISLQLLKGVLLRRRFLHALSWLAAALFPTGCSGLGLLDALTPSGSYTATTDIAYGALPRQKLDVYRPQGAGPHPVIVFFYGGGWQSGERGPYRFVAETLTRHGYVIVIPDYRVYPEARFPTFIEDAAQAVGWARDNAARIGGDPSRLFLMGHSAGAHIAAMVALDARYLAKVGMERRELKGFIGLAGPYDFLPLTSDKFKTILAAPDMAQTQPITFADEGAPPMFLLHGLDDTTVLPRNSVNFATRLRENGAVVETRYYPDMAHVGILLGLSSLVAGDQPVLADILAFLQR